MNTKILKRALEMAVDILLESVPKGMEYCYHCPCDDECYGTSDNAQCRLNIIGFLERKATTEIKAKGK